MDEQNIFLQALEQPAGEIRDKWLAGACGGDAELRARIDALLARGAQAESFLENPPSEFEATIIHQAENDRVASLEAGLAATFGQDEAVVLGEAGHSVLKSLGKSIDVPRVALRDPKEEGPEPITRSRSPEMPQKDSDSRYQLHGEIARGGMGAIIKGRDNDLGRDLAIKVLLDSHKDKPEVIQRFVEEAQIGGQLQHPGIAPIYELGQFADKRPFFSMKLVKGETLSKLLAQRKEPAEDRGRFLGIFEQICQTMAYAHSRGVIHRDLKPANIMVGAFGEVQVMDWGLAKVLPAGGVADEKKAYDKQQGHSVIQTLRSGVGSDAPGTFGTLGSQTQMGSVMGTPAYMPPEQALGEIDNLDERADVFGLGAILCEILTGKPPYVADDGTRVFRLASRGKLDDCFQRLEACGADEELIALTKQCLTPEPADRPRDASVLAERVTAYLESVETKLRETELERAAQAARADAEAAQANAERQRAEAESQRAESESARAQEERKRRRTSLALAASVLLLVGVGSGGWLYFLRQEADRQTSEADAQRKHAREMDQQRQVAVEAQQTAERNLAKAEAAEREARERAIAEAAAKALAERESQRAETEAAQARKSEQAARELAVKEAAARTLAQQETQRAEAATAQFKEQLIRSEWLLYASKLMLARTDFEAGNGGLARHYLDECPMDLRGWEHRYLLTRITARQTLVGHDLLSVAVSPDSQWIVTGGRNSTVKVWNAETGEQLRLLQGHTQGVRSVTFSPDGRRIATGSWDKTAKVWDAKTGQELLSLEGHIGPVHCVAFSPDGKRVVAGGGEPYQLGEVTVWDAITGRELVVLKGHDDRVFSLAFSPDGKHIVTGSARQARVWDATTGRQILSFRHEEELGFIWSVAYSPDGTRIATSCENGNTKVWNAETGEQLRLLQGHTQGVKSVTFSPDGRRIATGSWDNTVKIWDAERGEATQTIKGHANSVWGVAFNGDGSRIVSASSDGTAKVWDAERGQKVTNIKIATIGSITGVAFSPDSRRVVTAGEQGIYIAQQNTANVFNVKTGKKLLALQGHTTAVWSVAFSPDGRRIATGGNDKTVREWDAATGQQLRVLTGNTSPVAFSPDGSQLATGHHDDNTLRLVDTETGQELLSLAGHTGLIRSVAFAPNGTRVVTASEDGTAKVWDAETGKELLSLSNVDASMFSSRGVAFSRDGNLIVTACRDHTARVWDAESGRELLALKGHTERVISVAFSPDGQRVVTGSYDKSAKLWELQRGLEVFSFPAYNSEVKCVAFSPDGQRIVTCTANPDNTVRVWHADRTTDNNAWPLPDATERIRYHTEQAELAAREYQLFAAEFHLRRVLRDDPENTAARVQLDTIVHTIPFKIAFKQGEYARAARIWKEALAVNPKLGDDRQQQHSYNAACAAALTADGQGQIEAPLDDTSKANLRMQALNWLKAELTLWGNLLETGPPENRPFIVFMLKHWQKDPDLTSIRDAASLSKLPTAEQESFTQLWTDVEALLKKADPATKP